MFCSKCGKELSDGVQFCDQCGNQISGEQTTVPSTVASSPNPTVENFIKTLKGFFSKNTIKSIGASAQSDGLEWIIFAVLGILSYSLALFLNAKSLINDLLGSLSDFISDGIKLGNLFLWGMLISAVAFFAMSFGVFAFIQFYYKKNVKLSCVFNLVGAASIPMICAFVLNIILGFIWFPIVIVLSISGIVATTILIYAGIQKIEKLDRSPFWGYTIIYTLVTIIIFVVIAIIIKSFGASITESLGDTLGSIIGGIL